VIRSNGSVGGYVFGVNKKIEKLRREGVVVEKRRVNLNKFRVQVLKLK